jgi:hypothetical protein
MRKYLPFLAALAAVVVTAGTSLAQDPTPTPQAEVAQQPAPAHITIDLAAGFPLDPFFVSVNGGGSVPASTLSPECTGYVQHDPTVTVHWAGSAPFVNGFVFSDHDPVLVIRQPDGSYLCNDDANPLLLDPVIKITDPISGTYDVWVGSYSAQQLIPGVFVITGRPDVNLGTFALADLVRRAPIPEQAQEPVHQQDIAILLNTLNAAAAAKVAEGVSAAPIEVTGGGDVPAFDLPLTDLICNGFINREPSYLFDWAGEADNLRVQFEGAQDTTLVVLTPSGAVLCADDAEAGANLNPVLDITDPDPGNYAVFVGTLVPNNQVTGTLTITDAAAVPAILTPPQ